MIKVYKLRIGEKVYEVELESITEKEGSIVTTATSSKAEGKTATPVVETKTEAVAGGTEVEAPMQGVIVDLVVSVGDAVSAGDDLVILEAMKMENPIVAPVSGKVVSIHVAKGENVDMGKVLVTLA